MNQLDKILLYIIRNWNIVGRKKLMKLMFLINNYDVETDKVIQDSYLGLNFKIYSYGVYSDEVMKTYFRLYDEGKITEMTKPGNTDVSLKTNINVDLEDYEKSKIDSIMEKFNDKTGRDLELSTLELLGLTLDTKLNHMGQNISELL